MSLRDMTADEVFHTLVRRATGGQDVKSMKAPALSTEYVRSSQQQKARANTEGAMFEITFPSTMDIYEKILAKHGEKRMFGYRTTAASDAYPVGYGERSANALVKEDNIAQLKGSFPQAALSISKLKARADTRIGDVGCVNRIFSRFWGLEEGDTEELPQMHISGSEATRMSAMEDRAYHALACHPAYSGGYRVDMASVASDALGENVPINWPRIRTGMKAIALVQCQGDLEIDTLRTQLKPHESYTLTMGLVQDSQPRYLRSYAWERMVDRLMEKDDPVLHPNLRRSTPTDMGEDLMRTFTDTYIETILDQPDISIRANVTRTADLVRSDAKQSIERISTIIEMYANDRALADEQKEEDYEDHIESELTQSFHVPIFKVTRTSLHGGVSRQNIGKDKLPDMKSHGRMPLRLNYDEFRAANLVTPMTIPGALNLAVYIVVLRPSQAVASYRLLSLVKDPKPGALGSVAGRLRRKEFYSNDEVYAVGRKLFGEEFLGVFETIVHNMTEKSPRSEEGIKHELWHYLSRRSDVTTGCSIRGGWRDLIEFLRTSPVGWTLYYWARIAIGKLQFASSCSILAPIAAGDEVDLLTLMKKSVRERTIRWRAYYVDKYQEMINDFKLRRRKDDPEEEELLVENVKKYVPPHLRSAPQLDQVYDAEEILNRAGGYTHEEYQRMVEMQVKAKFFGKIDICTYNRELSIGVTDAEMRDILIEGYQARWYSLEKRIEHAKSRGKIFRLGTRELEEHPWGPLITDFSESLNMVRDELEELDVDAWTLHPTYVWEKYIKSISELWEDVANELNAIVKYISEVQDCAADAQTEAYALRRVEDVRVALSGVPAIALPVMGYRAPFKLPVRLIEVEQQGEVSHLPTSAQAFAVPVPLLRDDNLDDDFGQLEDTDDILDVVHDYTYLSTNIHLPKAAQVTRHLTYNEIWKELQLDEVEDAKKRYAFGIDFEANLDEPHEESQYGPMILFEDREKTKRAWAGKMGGILRRLGLPMGVDIADDM